MASMVSARHPRRAGEKARDHIQRELQARQAAGEPAPTVDELVEDMRMAKGNVRHHVAWLVDAGVVEIREEKREVTRRVIVLVERARP